MADNDASTIVNALPEQLSGDKTSLKSTSLDKTASARGSQDVEKAQGTSAEGGEAQVDSDAPQTRYLTGRKLAVVFV